MRLPKHSTVVAYTALFVTLGGAAYAAPKLAANSVGSTQIQNGSIRSTDIRNGSVGVADLSKTARGSMPTKARIASAVEDVITDPQYGLTINVKGEKGDKGDTGATGAAGAAGANGKSYTTNVATANSSTVNIGQTGEAVVRCAAGQDVLGGGAEFSANNGTVTQSHPVLASPGNPPGWRAAVRADSTSGIITAYAICATPTQ